MNINAAQNEKYIKSRSSSAEQDSDSLRTKSLIDSFHDEMKKKHKFIK